jgi:hypothetical protein
LVTADTRERRPAMVLTRLAAPPAATLPAAPPTTAALADYRLYAHDPAHFAAVFDAATARALSELGPAEVRFDPDGVSVLMAGIVRRRGVMRRAIGLAERLAAPVANNPYR